MSGQMRRLGGALGLAHVVVMMSGFAIYVRYLDPRDPLTERYAGSNEALMYLGGYVESVGLLLFLPFAAYLFRLLRSAEGPSAFGAHTALAAGVIYISQSLTPGLAAAGAATRVGHSTTSTEPMLAALDNLRNFSYYLSLLALAVFLGAVAASALTTRVLPRWLAASAAVLSALLTLGVAGAGDGWHEPAALLGLVWVLAASVWSLRGDGSSTGEPVDDRSGEMPAKAAAAGAPSSR